MPIRKNVSKVSEEKLATPTRPRLHKINDLLATLFYSIWIVIGVFLILVIVSEVRQGALKSLISGPSQTQQPASSAQAPTETDIPGIGTVNIACVKSALSADSIQKILTDGNISGLSSEEKTKFEPCVVAAASPIPASSSPATTPKK